MLLSAEAEHEERGGLVRFKVPPTAAAAPVAHWTEAFGECGDRGCGCYRLREPRVRTRFRNFVVNRTVEQLSNVAPESATGDDTDGACTPAEEGTSVQARPGVRYVSVGCGSLLTDFEILCGLQEKGFAIEHIALADSEYRGRSHQIFRCLAAFFAPARVVAFDSMGDLRQAAQDEPESHGHATTFCKIDASGIGDITAKACAARLLAPGGHAFVINNDGRCKAGRQCWRRSDSPGLDEASAGATDPAWAGRMDTVQLDEEEGRRDPLGGIESSESWERPLWDGAESDAGPVGQPSHWQNQKKEATLDDDALQAALNLL